MFPTRSISLLVVLAGMLLAAPPVLAAPGGEATPLNLPAQGGQAAASGGGTGLVRTIVGLAVVLAVIYGLYWVLRQVKASREGAVTGSGLESLATVPLGPGRSVHLVRVGRDLVLLGVSEGALAHLRTYDEDEARDAGLLVDEDPFGSDEAAAPPSAVQALRDVVERLRRRTVRR
jgi:flagellar protein FliO/FliZ